MSMYLYGENGAGVKERKILTFSIRELINIT